MAKKNMTAAQASANWATGMNNAVSSGAVTRGVQAVNQAPGQLAANAVQLWTQQVSSMATQQKWAQRVAAVSLNSWQQDTINKGIPRITGGVQESTGPNGKATSFFNALIAYEQSGLSSLPPRGGFNNNVNRATAWMNYMHNFRYVAGGGQTSFLPGQTFQ